MWLTKVYKTDSRLKLVHHFPRSNRFQFLGSVLLQSRSNRFAMAFLPSTVTDWLRIAKTMPQNRRPDRLYEHLHLQG